MPTFPGNSGQDADKPETPEVSVSLDTNAADLLDPVAVEPKQVKDTTVIYVPRKDFEARVNQDIFQFRAGVPTKVTRDILAMLLEDPDRGYAKD